MLNPPRLGTLQVATIAGSVCLLTALAHGSEGSLRFVKKFQIPESSEVVVVAEGELEPRSVGSYALRVYRGVSQRSPTDDFVAGVIRPRNGTLQAVKIEDIDGDNKPEIVVIIRSAGSGGYLSADAFRYRDRSLEWVGSVSHLDKGADPLCALRDKFKVSDGNKG